MKAQKKHTQRERTQELYRLMYMLHQRIAKLESNNVIITDKINRDREFEMEFIKR